MGGAVDHSTTNAPKGTPLQKKNPPVISYRLTDIATCNVYWNVKFAFFLVS